MNEMPTRYNPKETEDKWYKFWEENNYFRVAPNPTKKPFCIVIPPPNVTGILHMGHALNNTIQDILIRYHRMKGDESLWMPGTDHAGIATQNVVEKSLAKEGLSRSDLGREKFVERVWQWRDRYGSTIIHQLKKLGASCDWQRTRFTMDEEYSQAVLEVFIRLYEKGLIYQGNYIINWCPRCQTALSNEEAPHKELPGNLYYIRYPFADSNHPEEFIVVATTRPETMLGDTAVAVHPEDQRYKHFVGKKLMLPLIKRVIPIIADEMVDKTFGTGAVKVTPAHDPGDYALGKKHALEFITVMHPDGSMNEQAGQYQNLDRFEARTLILERLKNERLLEKIQPHIFSAGHCYRCQTITEPYLSKQWFVRMKPLAEPALAAVKEGKVRFYPERWTKVYLNWMEDIQDWCISRQIWWGHRIPVYYCKKCQEAEKSEIRNKSQIPNPKQEPGIIVSRTKPEECPVCSSTDIYQDEDVLDTWFSSWLWPFATFYWPFQPSAISYQLSAQEKLIADSKKQKADLEYFYPTSVLVTAPEIIFFWVARMIMAGCEFTAEVPFQDVYIHGTVRDIEGKKMSKSLGNIIDPLEIIETYGADALRFSLVSITAQGTDVYLSKERFEQGRNFANKIWNVSRFILANLDASRIMDEPWVLFQENDLNLFNRWILSRFYSVLSCVNIALETYRFNEAATILYSFIWHEFCDWYVEIIKPHIQDYRNQVVMYNVFEKTLRILHPFIPFITEEIWQRLPYKHQPPSIMVADWPYLQERSIDKDAQAQVQILFDTIRAIRNLRSEIDIRPEQKIVVSIYPHSPLAQQLLAEHVATVVRMANLEKMEVLNTPQRPPDSVSTITGDVDVYLHFVGLIDVAKEKTKIQTVITAQLKRLESKKKLTGNQEFIQKAEHQVVETIKQEVVEIEQRIKRLENVVRELR